MFRSMCSVRSVVVFALVHGIFCCFANNIHAQGGQLVITGMAPGGGEKSLTIVGTFKVSPNHNLADKTLTVFYMKADGTGGLENGQAANALKLINGKNDEYTFEVEVDTPFSDTTVWAFVSVFVEEKAGKNKKVSVVSAPKSANTNK